MADGIVNEPNHRLSHRQRALKRVLLRCAKDDRQAKVSRSSILSYMQVRRSVEPTARLATVDKILIDSESILKTVRVDRRAMSPR